MDQISWNDFGEEIGPFFSECLVTGLYRKDGNVVLAVPDSEVYNGARLG